ncbi:DUF1513 domain-containing protein [Ideonella paludis]|uniref:DUF1513 domain-containing protein n=1 Tax=Ideonella paludis TaxID=1233411 RepID=A0ABS5DZU1_9BURK|nr:DUF1513 domain-containing protein [Ideonella paludis]MBQ0936665.1 DUF1513 domain-containing protein [Ideonella paludis]
MLGPCTAWASANDGAQPRCVAAWDGHDGRHWVGLLQADSDASLRVLAAQALPTRAHGLTLEADGSVLVVARRPGEWLLRWHPQQARPPQWHWLSGVRVLGGHALVPAKAELIYTIEQDANHGQGWLVARDRQSLAEQAAWPTGGLDPHMALLDGPGHVLVANGGAPPAGVSRASTGLQSSLVRLSLRDGALQGAWTLPDRHLSLRHLARHASGRIGIALQAEHPEAAARLDAPLLALFDGQALRLAEAHPGLGGYGGDIAADAEGFVVSASRAGLPPAPLGALARWDLTGQRRSVTAWPQAGALSPGWAAGQTWQTPQAPSATPSAQVKAWDNHLG